MEVFVLFHNDSWTKLMIMYMCTKSLAAIRWLFCRLSWIIVVSDGSHSQAAYNPPPPASQMINGAITCPACMAPNDHAIMRLDCRWIYKVHFMSDSLNSVWGLSDAKIWSLLLPKFSSNFNQTFGKVCNWEKYRPYLFLAIYQILKVMWHFQEKLPHLHCHYP